MADDDVTKLGQALAACHAQAGNSMAAALSAGGQDKVTATRAARAQTEQNCEDQAFETYAPLHTPPVSAPPNRANNKER